MILMRNWNDLARLCGFRILLRFLVDPLLLIELGLRHANDPSWSLALSAVTITITYVEWHSAA